MSDTNLLAQTRDVADLYPAIQSALDQIVGHKLFTLMAIDHARGEAARIYTSHPAEYPVGGRKPLGDMTAWGKIVLQDRQPWIAYNAADIEGAFFDHALIAELGCASCLNVPVIEEDTPGGPRVIGTINLLHGEGHYAPEHIDKVAPFAALLVQSFQDWADAAG